MSDFDKTKVRSETLAGNATSGQINKLSFEFAGRLNSSADRNDKKNVDWTDYRRIRATFWNFQKQGKFTFKNAQNLFDDYINKGNFELPEQYRNHLNSFMAEKIAKDDPLTLPAASVTSISEALEQI
tara:strand:- start:379 stop:759 length:381 start_codon:yes stop_codon:yes gene_type:complete